MYELPMVSKSIFLGFDALLPSVWDKNGLGINASKAARILRFPHAGVYQSWRRVGQIASLQDCLNREQANKRELTILT